MEERSKQHFEADYDWLSSTYQPSDVIGMWQIIVLRWCALLAPGRLPTKLPATCKLVEQLPSRCASHTNPWDCTTFATQSARLLAPMKLEKLRPRARPTRKQGPRNLHHWKAIWITTKTEQISAHLLGAIDGPIFNEVSVGLGLAFGNRIWRLCWVCILEENAIASGLVVLMLRTRFPARFER